MFTQGVLTSLLDNNLKYNEGILLSKKRSNGNSSNIAFKSTNYRPIDSTFIPAIPPSDDGSSDTINLPFDFCFYGKPQKQVFINTNGNISFENKFTSGTPFDFPFPNFKVIAPFWSDVDTRARGGVYYKILPNALIVAWEDVGYFDQNTSKGNTFQLIISDGTSELLPFGYTVGFFYHDIQWTTGDGSGGRDGFGGAPALVGINAGDGVNYVQGGKYDKNDTSWVQSVDSLNGVIKLNKQHTFLNPCDSINQKPGVMGYKIADTIGVCVGDTLREIYRFLAPESDQRTYVTVTSPGFFGFSLLQTNTGQMATASFEIVGSVANMGFHTISFRLFDNGSPSNVLDIDIVVQVDSLPEPLQIIGDTFICVYDSTQLKVASVYETYLWNTFDVDSSLSVGPGDYTVTVSANNCEVVQTQKVIGYIPEPIISGPQFICIPNTIPLLCTTGYDSYKWNTGDTTSQLMVSQAGTYTVTVTDQGCVNEDVFELEDSIYVNITTSNINSCNGDSVTLFIQDEYDHVVWSTGETTNSIQVLAGTYWVEVAVFSTGGSLCVESDTIVIGSSSITPVSVVGDSAVCGEEMSYWQVVGTYDSYLWDNESTQQITFYDTPGFHSVTVTDGTCIDSVSFQYQSILEPSVQIQGSLFYCDDVDSARLVAVGGIWDSLSWNTGDLTDTIYTGFGWKKVTVYKDGCSAFAWHPVNELINGVDVQGITEICQGQSTRLEVEMGFDLYTWNTGAIGFSTIVNSPGQYWCVVNLDTCSATTDTVTVTLVNADPAQIMGDTVMCDTAGGQLYVDLNFRQFVWNTGETTPSIFYTQTGWYFVTVEDERFCVTSDSVFIEQKPKPIVEIVGDTHYCFNDSVWLSVGDFENYLWVNGETTQTIKARAGTYGIIVIDSNGCTATDKNHAVTQSAPLANIFSDTMVCDGDSLWVYTLTNTKDSIVWSTGEMQDSIYILSGTIGLSVQDGFGCKSDSVRVISGFPAPTAGINMTPAVQSQAYLPVDFIDNSEVNGVNVQDWYWNINDSIISSSEDTSVLFYSGLELMIVHAITSNFGCTDTVKANYLITDDIIKVNVITPNGDGVNDYLVFPNLQKFPNNVLRIYNRWGVEVAFLDKYKNTWDANLLPDGVYFYTIKLEEDIPLIQGTVTVIRE